MRNEMRFRMTENQDPERYKALLETAKENIQEAVPPLREAGEGPARRSHAFSGGKAGGPMNL
jgi:hypothetical protein